MIRIIGENRVKFEKSPRFQKWLERFDRTSAEVLTIEEGWSLWKGEKQNKLVFALLFMRCCDEKGRERGDVVFYRSDAAAAFLVIKDKDSGKKYAVLIEQLRIATGGKRLEIPAGSVEEEDDFLATIVREVKEEVGLSVSDHEFHALGLYYPSPGACNEIIALYFCEVVLTSRDISDLQGRLTGTPGEHTKVMLYPLEDFEELGICDAKTVLAYHLYLKKAGK